MLVEEGPGHRAVLWVGPAWSWVVPGCSPLAASCGVGTAGPGLGLVWASAFGD